MKIGWCIGDLKIVLQKLSEIQKVNIVENSFMKTVTILKSFRKLLSRSSLAKKQCGTNIDVNGGQIHDDKEIASSVNKFFTKTVDRGIKVFGRCLSTARSFKFLMSGPLYTFHFEEASVDFIHDQLKELKTKKAVGLDQLSAHLLKDSAEIIAKPLLLLMLL